MNYTPNNLHITHYWAAHNDNGRWSILGKARDVFGVNYSTSCGGKLRIVTAAEAEHIYRTGTLPPPPNEAG